MNTKPFLALCALAAAAVLVGLTGDSRAFGHASATADPQQSSRPDAQQAAQQDCTSLVDPRQLADSVRAQIAAMQENSLAGVRAQVQSALAEKQALLAAAENEQDAALRASWQALQNEAQSLQQNWNGEAPRESNPFDTLLQMEGSGWLGIEIEEVSADRAKQLQLAAPAGVYVREVETDSPAQKAGLKVGDVITDFNGEHVEGSVQFRRLVRETPAERSVQLQIWRDGRAQTLRVTLGEAPLAGVAPTPRPAPGPGTFSLQLPNIEIFNSAAPTIGVEAEDLSGQLGTYFGAPDGEGILVREVQSGSPAEKAGMKAGDVIVKMDGERVRNLGELRDKLRDKRDAKTVQFSVLRRGSEQNLTVEPNHPETRTRNVRRATI
jgi:serine protease Do